MLDPIALCSQKERCMKIIIIGNSGSGKSTLARRLGEKERVQCLSLDDIAFSDGAQRKRLNESIEQAVSFIHTHKHWIIEGCYADIIKPLLIHADTLIFLNPGIDACIRHCQNRPWEPGKFVSKEAQDAHLQGLLDWVRDYTTREDEYGLKQHRSLFEGFTKEKVEWHEPAHYSLSDSI